MSQRVHDSLFIGGDWVAPATAATIEVVSPLTEQSIGRVPKGSDDDVDRAVAAAATRSTMDPGPAWNRASEPTTWPGSPPS